MQCEKNDHAWTSVDTRSHCLLEYVVIYIYCRSMHKNNGIAERSVMRAGSDWQGESTELRNSVLND